MLVPFWLPRLLLPLVVPVPPLLAPPLVCTEPPCVPCAVCGADVSFEHTPRSVCASLVASAFFRYTTWTLPASAVGWSSLAMIERARLARAGDGARTTT